MEFVNAVKIVQSVGGHGWFGATYNMNIYRGCNQGCIYCDSRSSCYQIKDFDTVRAKKDAPLLIDKELNGNQERWYKLNNIFVSKKVYRVDQVPIERTIVNIHCNKTHVSTTNHLLNKWIQQIIQQHSS